MRILAIDTSSARGSVAISSDGDLLAQVNLASGADHSRRLLATIDFLLASLGFKLADIDCYAVASGPGSFTGIRIGISTAKGLAQVMGKRVVAITALEALAHKIRWIDGLICPMIDAQRGQVYTCLYTSDRGKLRRVRKDALTEPERWLKLLARRRVWFVGDGAVRFQDLIAGMLRYARIVRTNLFLADSIAEMAAARIGREVRSSPFEVDAYYIRPAEAEVAARRRAQAS